MMLNGGAGGTYRSPRVDRREARMCRLSEQEREMLLEHWKAKPIPWRPQSASRGGESIDVLHQQGLIEVKRLLAGYSGLVGRERPVLAGDLVWESAGSCKELGRGCAALSGCGSIDAFHFHGALIAQPQSTIAIVARHEMGLSPSTPTAASAGSTGEARRAVKSFVSRQGAQVNDGCAEAWMRPLSSRRYLALGYCPLITV